MVATAFGPLLLLLFPLAGSANDLLSLIDAADYFQTRQVEVQADKLAELAGKKPEGSADRVAQLLAIRWLGENPDAVKKSQNARAVLQQLADGKLGQDPLGFARDYAARALARLDGKKPVLAAIGGDSLKSDALAWFPDGVTFFYAVDVRSRLKEPLLDESAIVASVRQMLPPEGKQFLYNLADTVGNVRVDRLAIGMTMTANGQPERIYVRFSGLGDRDLLARYLFVQVKGTERKDEKGPKGEPITFLEFTQTEPALAIVGNTDLIVAGRERPMKDSLDIVREVLEVRAGKKASAVQGSLAKALKEAPAGASMLLGGPPPNELARMLLQPRGPLAAAPKESLISLVVDKTIDLRVNARLGSAEEAKGLGDAAAALKQQGLAALKAPGLPLQGDARAALQKVIESINVESNGEQIQISAQSSAEIGKTLMQVLQLGLMAPSSPPPRPFPE